MLTKYKKYIKTYKIPEEWNNFLEKWENFKEIWKIKKLREHVKIFKKINVLQNTKKFQEPVKLFLNLKKNVNDSK